MLNWAVVGHLIPTKAVTLYFLLIVLSGDDEIALEEKASWIFI